MGRRSGDAGDARRRGGRDARRRPGLPHVRQRPLLWLPGNGDRRLDRQRPAGLRSDGGSHGPFLLRGGALPRHQRLGERCQGVPVVLLRRQRTGAQRGGLGPPRRAVGGHRHPCRRRGGRRESPRPQGAHRRRHAARPASGLPADAEDRRPAGRLDAGLAHLDQDRFRAPGTAHRHRLRDVPHHGRRHRPDVHLHR